MEAENDRIKEELDIFSQKHTHENILKYKLWEECNKTCPYTGREINIQQLFSGEVQIEHIQPWSKSLNDSFMNKTLCFADENRAKGDKTPYEFYFNEQSPEKWERVKAQALSCFKNKYPHYPNAYNKFKQFVKQTYDDDFVSRQLNDTRYISKEAKTYLSKICKKIMVSPGRMTATLRYKWGLNSILNDDVIKSRDDHRHHAVDALVIACSTVAHLQELSKWNRYRRKAELNNFPKPWNSFLEDARDVVQTILVSHKKTDKLITIRTHHTKKDGNIYVNKGIAARGQLHKETVYGKRKAPEEEQAFHIRKPIESLTTRKHIEKIVDPAIRKLIFDKIEKLGGFEKDDKIPQKTFFITDADGNKQPQIFLPNKNGEPVPVKKVRMREHISGAEQLKKNINQFVNPRNNHHVLIYKNAQRELKEDVVTFWKAAARKKEGQNVFQLPEDGTEIVTILQINDMFLLGLKEVKRDLENIKKEVLIKHLFRVQKLSSKSYEFRLVSESKLDKNRGPYYFRIQSFGTGKTGWQTFNPVKVSITPAGRIKRIEYK